MRQEERCDQKDGLRNASWTVSLLCRALAISVEVFLHRPGSFGERYFGLQTALAVVLIFFWPVLCDPSSNAEPLQAFLFAFLALVFVARLVALSRRSKAHQHSYYTGTPWLMLFAGEMPEEKVKRLVEPLIVWLAGVLLLGTSPPLGGYLMVAGFGLGVSTHVASEYERRRSLDMHDAYVEQRNIAERFRDMRGE